MLFEFPVRTVGRSVLKLRSMKFKDEASARFNHLTITIVVLFSERYFEPEDGVFLGHSCWMSAKRHESWRTNTTYS